MVAKAVFDMMSYVVAIVYIFQLRLSFQMHMSAHGIMKYFLFHKLPLAPIFYTRKNYELLKVDENSIKQCCAAHIVQCCREC